jgi:hypothetical protein
MIISKKMPLVFAFALASLHLSHTVFPTIAFAQNHSNKHKLWSAHHIITSLEKKNLHVMDIRRHAQIYAVKVKDQAGNTAILSIDGKEGEIVGVTPLTTLSPSAPSTGPKLHHFTSITQSFGYSISETTYSSYIAVSSTEQSSSQSYVEEDYAESDEEHYDATDDDDNSSLDDDDDDSDDGDDGDDGDDDGDD